MITRFLKGPVFAVLLCLLLGGMIHFYRDTSHSREVKSLKPAEVRDYRGERLSSIDEFIENSIAGPQYVDRKTYRLKITGRVGNPRSYTYDEVINRSGYKKVVTLHCVEGWSVKILWEGVLLKELLHEANPAPQAKVAIFYAHDGYSTSLPLRYIAEKNILMAYKMNNVVLPPERGFPFQLVAEDKWGYKWIKWITKIELSDDTNYRGYWERRGYNQGGDLKGSKFE